MMKESQIRIRLDKDLHDKFIGACRENDLTASQVLRMYMREYVDKYSDDYQVDLFEEYVGISN